MYPLLIACRWMERGWLRGEKGPKKKKREKKTNFDKKKPKAPEMVEWGRADALGLVFVPPNGLHGVLSIDSCDVLHLTMSISSAF